MSYEWSISSYYIIANFGNYKISIIYQKICLFSYLNM